jgi:hypothetical protein
MTCPKCGAECGREEADVGVGIMYGPWGCGNCGWREDDDPPYGPLLPVDDEADPF